MLTLRAAAGQLMAADSPKAIGTLLASLGIGGVPRRLDARRRTALGITESLRDAHIVAGPDDVRALIAVAHHGPSLREQLPRLAARLQSRAPHVLWLLALVDGRDGTIALSAWSGEHRPPRVRSLLVDRAHVVDSDAETVCALAAATVADGVLLHLRWTEILGRDALSHRFYRDLECRVAELADSASRPAPMADRRSLALLHTSRLLFLAFLEAKGWLDGRRSFLAESFDAQMAAGGSVHTRLLRPLFFGTLNTPVARRAAAARRLGRIPFLNGGLFAPTAVERRHTGLHFGDAAFGALIGGLFSRYRFTAREDAATWSDAAVDPEMLGRAFESLMGTDDRRDSGAFFTPQRLVEHVTDIALVDVLHEVGFDAVVARGLMDDGAGPEGDTGELRRRLSRIAVLDPACGSGAFLVYTLQRLAALRVALGDRRTISEVRRDVLTTSVFGVDRNPMAVWLCELRLWLSVVIECDLVDPMVVAPLPNLDRNVRVGDSLSGPGFAAAALYPGGRSVQLATLRRRYARATGTRKHTLGRAIDRAERSRAIAMLDRALTAVQHARRERLLACRGRDLFGDRRAPSSDDREALASLRRRAVNLRRERRRLVDGGALPFSFAVHFAGVADRGGFDAVVGNPPWVRLHRVPPADRARLRSEYSTFRYAQWRAGAAAAHAAAGFAGQADLSALFIERSVSLLGPRGSLALLVPAKLWHALAGGGVRRLLCEQTRVTRIEDLSDAPAQFRAAVYPSVIAARAGAVREDDTPPPIEVSVHRAPGVTSWSATPAQITFDSTPGSPWLLLPPPVRAAFDRLRHCGTPLAASPVGRPVLGTKCGCNDAFVVEVIDDRGAVACIRAAGGRTGDVERTVLRPVLRGETVRAWRARPGVERILWPYDHDGLLLDELPPRTRRWLLRYRTRLQARADARSGPRWWALFRTDGARPGRPRVVWADFGRRPRALVLGAADDTVPLNTCYVARCDHADDARTLAAILNSAVAAAWLNVLAEPARGGFRRYLGWTVAALPLPSDWRLARRVLAPMVAQYERRDELETLPSAVLTDAVLHAFGLRLDEIGPLLEWNAP